MTRLPAIVLRHRVLALLMLVGTLAACPASQPGPDAGRSETSVSAERYKLAHTADGDSFEVIDDRQQRIRVRIAGIDSPEKGQAYADRARINLIRLLSDRPIRLEVLKTDRYGRQVANVFVSRRDIGLMQVEQGFAWHFSQYAHEQTPAARGDYEQAERLARENGRGLWQDPRPIPPWDYRRQQRGQKSDPR